MNKTNIMTAAEATQPTNEPVADKYPTLSPALDRDERDGPVTEWENAPPASPAPATPPNMKPRKPAVGAVLKPGVTAPEVERQYAANEVVRVRITKAGAGLIHNGSGGTYCWQDEVALPYAVAKAQEDNKNAEIIG